LSVLEYKVTPYPNNKRGTIEFNTALKTALQAQLEQGYRLDSLFVSDGCDEITILVESALFEDKLAIAGVVESELPLKALLQCLPESFQVCRNIVLDLFLDLLCRTGNRPIPAIPVVLGGNVDHLVVRLEIKVDGPIHGRGVNLHFPSHVPRDAASLLERFINPSAISKDNTAQKGTSMMKTYWDQVVAGTSKWLPI
jgi:hypothetical protein